MKIDRFLNGESHLARGKRTIEGMHQLVEEGAMQFVAGKPYEREYGHIETTQLEQLEAEQNMLLQMLNERETVYSNLTPQMKGKESYEKSE